MKVERDESGTEYIHASSAKEIKLASLKAAIGMNEAMINQAMDRAYPKYEKHFEVSTEKNADYQATVSKLQTETEKSKYKIRSRDQILDAVFMKLRVQNDASNNPNAPKKNPFKDMSSEQVLQMLRENNDVDFTTISAKRSQKFIVTNQDEYRAAKVSERLEIIKIAAINTFLREAGNVVAETRVSNPSLVEENRKEGMQQIGKIQNDWEKAREQTIAAKTKNEDNSFIGTAISLNHKLTGNRIAGRQNVGDISKFVNAVIPQIEQYIKHILPGSKNSELRTDDRKVIVSQLESAIQVLNEKRAVIDSSNTRAVEEYRERGDFQKFCGLIDQLEACKNEYIAQLKQEVSAKSEQALAAAPEVPKTTLSSRKPVQRQASLTDDQFTEAVKKADTDEASQPIREPARRDSLRRPSWTNRSDQQAAKVATQNDAAENTDQNQNVGRAPSLSSSSGD